MTAEIRKAVETFHLTPKQLREIIVCGFKRCFFHGSYPTKRKYIRCVMDTYDALAVKYDIQNRYDIWLNGIGGDNRMPELLPGSP